jgi:hypothetical protein
LWSLDSETWEIVTIGLRDYLKISEFRRFPGRALEQSLLSALIQMNSDGRRQFLQALHCPEELAVPPLTK